MCYQYSKSKLNRLVEEFIRTANIMLTSCSESSGPSASRRFREVEQEKSYVGFLPADNFYVVPSLLRIPRALPGFNTNGTASSSLLSITTQRFSVA